MLDIRKLLFLSGLCVLNNAFAARPVIDDEALEKEADSVLAGISIYEGELDPDKFVADPEKSTQVRRNLAKIVKIEGRSFSSSFIMSRNTFRRVMKLDNSELAYHIPKSDEIAFCDRYYEILTTSNKPTELRYLVEPCLYPAYYYCHRGVIEVSCKRSENMHPEASSLVERLLSYLK
ncbi:MAG: hypothetical protein LBQ43_02540 [Holosporales bacterium]|jgi:hypothetical protein|nr:hypothetical protein [Holosporales bacterium]